MMANFLRDLRFGVRMLLKRPGTSVLAILALALGIGLTSTMFSIVDAVFLRGLPFDHANEIVSIAMTTAKASARDITAHDYFDVLDAQHTFSAIGAYEQTGVDLGAPGAGPQRYDGARLTAGALALTRTPPVIGRLLSADDERAGAASVALIDADVWATQFQQAPDVLGRVVTINKQPATIVGVMPKGFGFPQTARVWLPLVLTRGDDSKSVRVVGRLNTGTSLRAANDELRAIGTALSKQSAADKARSFSAQPYVRAYMRAQIINTLTTLLAAVFGVLVIACVNVANLQLARAADRTKEIAVRLALGASRAQLTRQLFIEGVVLAIVGAAIGIGVAKLGIVFFETNVDDRGKPFWIVTHLDARTLGFIAVAAAFAAIVSSLVPAWRLSRMPLSDVLKDETRGGTSLRVGRFSRGLVAAQVMLSCTLLIAAGLMVRSMLASMNHAYPFRTDLFYGQVSLSSDRYGTDDLKREVLRQLQAHVAAAPGVARASITTDIPGRAGTGDLEIEGVPLPPSGTPPPFAESLRIDPAWFDTMGLRVARGRAFTAEDHTATSQAALVTQAFVDRYLAGQNPLGRRLRFGTNGKNTWREIVGVIDTLGSVSQNTGQPIPTVVTPIERSPVTSVTVLAAAAPGVTLPEAVIRSAIAEVDPDAVMYEASTVQRQYDRQTWPYKVFGTLILAVGLSALLMASGGLYGVMAFAVQRRLSEIGVRMALGADTRAILWMVLRQGAWLVGIGLALGLGLGVLLGSGLQQLLFGVQPWDPAVLTATVAVLATCGLLACLVPARRAAGVDPLIALRKD